MEEMMSNGVPGFCVKGGSRTASLCGGGGGGTKCGRWNPTSEQVKLLTDLFRSGLRTPTTDQIQKISSQLSFYGKIESKNVFYWFQNHKARERQKRRKVSNNVSSVSVTDDHHHDNNHIYNSNKSYPEIYQSLSHHHEHRVDDKLGLEPERVIETLQLFPLNSSESEKIRFHGLCKEKAFPCSFGTHDHQMDLPPLDLRLSFL